jgi:hypothetical protein
MSTPTEENQIYNTRYRIRFGGLSIYGKYWILERRFLWLFWRFVTLDHSLENLKLTATKIIRVEMENGNR